MHVAALVGHPVVKLSNDAAHLAGVAADHEVGQLVDGRLAGAPKPVERRLADTVQAFICNDPDKEPVFPARANRVGLDIDDLHSPPFTVLPLMSGPRRATAVGPLAALGEM